MAPGSTSGGNCDGLDGFDGEEGGRGIVRVPPMMRPAVGCRERDWPASCTGGPPAERVVPGARGMAVGFAVIVREGARVIMGEGFGGGVGGGGNVGGLAGVGSERGWVGGILLLLLLLLLLLGICR